MLKLPDNRMIRWLLAAGIFLVLVAVLRVPDDRGTAHNSAVPANSSPSGKEASVSGAEARPGPDRRPRTIGVETNRMAGAREIAPDPGKSSESSVATASLPEEESYLPADITDPAMAAGDAETDTINVGEYIDPEAIATGSDEPVVQVGEYIDPDADVPGS